MAIDSMRILSRRGWIGVAAWTGGGTLACMALMLAYNHLAFSHLSQDARATAMLSAVVLSTLIAGPALLLGSIRMRALASANRELGVIASMDSLTACLNRGAFTSMVGACLEPGDPLSRPGFGALLVVDADHFKKINDAHGHDRGDEALRLIAHSIRSVLRRDDIVGRLGGEEFGVFLPGVTRQGAEIVAERVRRAVETTPFVVDGKAHPLSVSVGGVVFDAPFAFQTLFRSADARLYQAKQGGRNKVELIAMSAA